MDIIKAYATNNLCYIVAQKMVPAGIVVHSTGANNPYLKRYVDAPDEVGINRYGNHWNTAKPGGRQVCVHSFIGYDKDKKICVAEILPLDICAWGVGGGKKGSYNFDPPYIQFEICEDDLTDATYYTEVFRVAAEYCAQLCKRYGIDTDKIVGHYEAYRLGYGSNHSDPEHWMKKFGDTMDDFRKQVADLLVNTSKKEKVETSELHKGDLVSIASNATYYSGKSIPAWVSSQNWYVKSEPVGDRVVIDQNETGNKSICSPIHRQYLKVVKASTASTSTEKNQSQNKLPYLVKIRTDFLDIRKGAGTNTAKVGAITDCGVYTIVEERSGKGATLWGKLKSGAGWISLDYAKKL